MKGGAGCGQFRSLWAAGVVAYEKFCRHMLASVHFGQSGVMGLLISSPGVDQEK